MNFIGFWDFKRFRLKDFLVYQLPLQIKQYILSEKFCNATLLEFQNFLGKCKDL